MNYHLISDTHFNHLKLEEWGGRSGDWQEKLWKGLLALPPEDVLIHLGDICIGEDEEIHRNLDAIACKKILVIGNHDKKSKQWYMEHGWDFVVDSFELVFMGEYILFTHRPVAHFWHLTRNIHGHTHGNLHRSEEYASYYDPDFNKDMSPELVGYRPIRLDTLINSWRKR